MSSQDFNKKAQDSQFRREFFGLAADLRCDRCNRKLPSGWAHIEYESADGGAAPVNDNKFGPVCVKRVKESRRHLPVAETIPLFVQTDIYTPPVQTGEITSPAPKKQESVSSHFNTRARTWQRLHTFVTKRVPKFFKKLNPFSNGYF